MRNKTDYAMKRFAQWFASVGGTIQTTVVIFVWAIAEQIFPNLDPNGFTFLYVLTLWSGCTQNLLAYVGNVSAEESKKSQDMLEQLMKNNIDLLHATIEVIENQQKTIDKLNEIVSHIAKEVDEIIEEIN